MKFDLTKFKNKTFVVQCETKNDFYDFINKLINMGIMKSEEIEFMNWNDYEEDTCVLYDGEVLYGGWENDNYTNVVNYKDLVFSTNFNIPELHSGMIVERRDKQLLFVAESYDGKIFLMGDNEFDEICYYDDNLINTEYENFDIVAIYKPLKGFEQRTLSGFIDKSKKGIGLIWKRKEPKKMTLAKISEALGYEVEVIDNE